MPAPVEAKGRPGQPACHADLELRHGQLSAGSRVEQLGGEQPHLHGRSGGRGRGPGVRAEARAATARAWSRRRWRAHAAPYRRGGAGNAAVRRSETMRRTRVRLATSRSHGAGVGAASPLSIAGPQLHVPHVMLFGRARRGTRGGYSAARTSPAGHPDMPWSAAVPTAARQRSPLRPDSR